ncbi:MAG: OB-fold nucleic acid binding domain-containing protein [Candidatus Shikimatogenerans bostrichidophilus]|nr:MAG: OB-fold nucleic acid binding domain-containing protein [Candidatus Shikimatogenerans bostrichidophilus]
MYRTNNCGELRLKDINKNVILSGWINKIRKMKLYTFIDIRDYYGITQLIIYKKINIKIKNEYLIKIKGKVIKRKKYNNKIKTGKIEILVKKIKILNKSKKLPFYIGEKKINNNLFKYRYLYLRHSKIKENLIFKFKIINLIRKFFIKKGFIELETPFLVKSSSEGARDFIIPYRKKKGLFYSLPQSPQIFKQLFMIGGFDKYYQIVKCFRDEDYRLDRQPEFTQLDLEMSFIKKEDIFKLIEFLIKYLLYKIFKLKKINFIKLSYKKVIKYYKTDKPDLRFKLFKIKIKKKYLKNNKKKKIDTFIIPNYYNIKNKKKINKILKKNKNILIYNKKKIKKKYIIK